MSRRVSNRKSRLSARSARRGLEVVFAILLLLAGTIGGPGAAASLPALFDLVTPTAVLQAQASANAPWQPTRRESVPLVLPPPRLRPSLDEAPVTPALEAVRFEDYAAPLPPSVPVRVPAIALVIDDLGNDAAATRQAIALPPQVSLAFLPYPAAVPVLAGEARAAGHQILVHVPMEAERDRDGSLKTGLWRKFTPSENRRRLEWALSRFGGYDGINNHEGSVFTADRRALVPVAQALYGRGLFFLDSRTSPLSQVVPVARAFGVPSAERDVFLDDDQAAPAVARQLQELERVARIEGVAIAIGHPHAGTLALVARWSANLKDFRLIPVSEAIRMKTELEMGVRTAEAELRLASSE